MLGAFIPNLKLLKHPIFLSAHEEKEPEREINDGSAVLQQENGQVQLPSRFTITVWPAYKVQDFSQRKLTLLVSGL